MLPILCLVPEVEPRLDRQGTPLGEGLSQSELSLIIPDIIAPCLRGRGICL